ncbi:hypothetical protein chiPu_0025005 [Chiloscyllium punctatum]|uniref:Uncharacterized protein n=1 Tax=Chiloscyllium punctatum TaxID=137246 RepID=A0A401TF84_CHIPU|nr:hypothetical protein [Chiloscyllium punctatum]
MQLRAVRRTVGICQTGSEAAKTWSEGVISALQACFECTDWHMFREAETDGDSMNLEEYTVSMICYISKCIDNVTVSKNIISRLNQRPWTMAKMCAPLRTHDFAFRADEKAARTTVRANLILGLQRGKACTCKENTQPLSGQR